MGAPTGALATACTSKHLQAPQSLSKTSKVHCAIYPHELSSSLHCSALHRDKMHSSHAAETSDGSTVQEHVGQENNKIQQWNFIFKFSVDPTYMHKQQLDRTAATAFATAVAGAPWLTAEAAAFAAAWPAPYRT